MMDVSVAYLNTSQQHLLHNPPNEESGAKLFNELYHFSQTGTLLLKLINTPLQNFLQILDNLKAHPYRQSFTCFIMQILLNYSTKKGIEALEFVDNITLIVIGKSTRSNNQKLIKVHNSVFKDWRAKHGTELSISKYQLIHINRK